MSNNPLQKLFKDGHVDVAAINAALLNTERNIFGVPLKRVLRDIAVGENSDRSFIFNGGKNTQKVWRALDDGVKWAAFVSAPDRNGCVQIQRGAGVLVPGSRMVKDLYTMKIASKLECPDFYIKTPESMNETDRQDRIMKAMNQFRDHYLNGTHESTANLLKGVIADALNIQDPTVETTTNIIVDAQGEDKIDVCEGVIRDIQFYIDSLHAAGASPRLISTMGVFKIAPEKRADETSTGASGDEIDKFTAVNFPTAIKQRFLVGTHKDFETWFKYKKAKGGTYVLYGKEAVHALVDRISSLAAPDRVVSIWKRAPTEFAMDVMAQVVRARPQGWRMYTHWSCLSGSRFISPDVDAMQMDYLTTALSKLTRGMAVTQHFRNGRDLNASYAYAGLEDNEDTYGGPTEDSEVTLTQFLKGFNSALSTLNQVDPTKLRTKQEYECKHKTAHRLRVIRATDFGNNPLPLDKIRVENLLCVDDAQRSFIWDTRTREVDGIEWNQRHNKSSIARLVNITTSFLMGSREHRYAYIKSDIAEAPFKLVNDNVPHAFMHTLTSENVDLAWSKTPTISTNQELRFLEGALYLAFKVKVNGVFGYTYDGDSIRDDANHFNKDAPVYPNQYTDMAYRGFQPLGFQPLGFQPILQTVEFQPLNRIQEATQYGANVATFKLEAYKSTERTVMPDDLTFPVNHLKDLRWDSVSGTMRIAGADNNSIELDKFLMLLANTGDGDRLDNRGTNALSPSAALETQFIENQESIDNYCTALNALAIILSNRDGGGSGSASQAVIDGAVEEMTKKMPGMDANWQNFFRYKLDDLGSRYSTGSPPWTVVRGATAAPNDVVAWKNMLGTELLNLKSLAVTSKELELFGDDYLTKDNIEQMIGLVNAEVKFKDIPKWWNKEGKVEKKIDKLTTDGVLYKTGYKITDMKDDELSLFSTAIFMYLCGVTNQRLFTQDNFEKKQVYHIMKVAESKFHEKKTRFMALCPSLSARIFGPPRS